MRLDMSGYPSNLWLTTERGVGRYVRRNIGCACGFMTVGSVRLSASADSDDW